MGRRRQRKSPGLGTVAVLLALILASVAIAQTQERFIGTVQWIDGVRIALALDNGASVPIDLTNVDQSAYQALGPGDRVIVTGTLSPDRERVMATSISPASN
jgi:hypothetical protein